MGKCSRISTLSDTVNANEKLCYIYGKLGSSLESGNLTKKRISREQIEQIVTHKSTEEEATKRRNILSEFKEK